MTQKSRSGLCTKMSPLFLAVLLTVAVTLAPSGVSAQVVYTSNFGDECQPTSRGQSFSYGTDYGIIAGQDGLQIVCPITKFTSGAGISSGDSMGDIEIYVDNHNVSPGLTCQVTLYSSYVNSSGATNVLEVLGPVQTYPTWGNYYMGDFSAVGWWGVDSWKYAQLECTLRANQELLTYQWAEAGSSTGQHIYAPSKRHCSPVSGYQQGTFNVGPSSLPTSVPAGYQFAPGGSPWFYQCYMPQYWTQFSMQPCISAVQSWDWAYWSTGPWGPSYAEPGSGQNSTWPTYNFPSATLPAAGHTNTAGTFLDTGPPYVYFQLNPYEGNYDGDPAILSWRDSYTQPQ
jgi:hypothetical protein